MRYQVTILRRAQKALGKLPVDAFENIKAAIFNLADNPRPHGSKKLTGRDGWRIRIGNYRVIYEINDRVLTILVIDIGDRKEIYRIYR